MKIAINTTSAVEGGGVTYIKNLLNHLSKTSSSHQFVILTTIPGQKTFYLQHPRFSFLPFRIPSKNPILRLWWEQFFLPLFLKREHIDVLFSPANVCPLFSSITNVLLIQNVEPFYETILMKRGLLQKLRLKLLKKLTLLSIKRAKMTIFPSKKALSEIERTGVFMSSAVVIHHGLDKTIFRSSQEQSAMSLMRKKHGLETFIFCASHIQRYKNLFELVQAFFLLKGRIDRTMKLVFAGSCLDTAYYNKIRDYILKKGIENRIVFLGKVPHEALVPLYSACKIFVLPSVCESFGLTLLEAMACGAPVLTSNMEPMTEMCRDAALYFDPMKPDSIAELMYRVLNDRSLMSDLKMKSIKRAENFSWKKTAEKILKTFEEVT